MAEPAAEAPSNPSSPLVTHFAQLTPDVSNEGQSGLGGTILYQPVGSKSTGDLYFEYTAHNGTGAPLPLVATDSSGNVKWSESDHATDAYGC